MGGRADEGDILLGIDLHDIPLGYAEGVHSVGFAGPVRAVGFERVGVKGGVAIRDGGFKLEVCEDISAEEGCG